MKNWKPFFIILIGAYFLLSFAIPNIPIALHFIIAALVVIIFSIIVYRSYKKKELSKMQFYMFFFFVAITIANFIFFIMLFS
jgi:hypothetical protein